MLVADRAALEPHRAAWAALAVACSRPFCAPDWLLAWWDRARPARAGLAVVLVRDGAELVGVAPGFCDRGPAGVVRWRPLAAQTCQHVEPFAVAGREDEVGRAIAGALHARRPRPQVLSFEGIPARSPWPALLAASWPGAGRARTIRTGASPSLVLDLEPPDFDAWFASRSSHFRQRLRRSGKAAVTAGAVFRLADASTAAADIESFLRVHIGRWEERGGSRAVPPPVAAMLRDAGPRLVADGRLRIWSLDVEGATIASSLVFCAGDQVGYWLNGFDIDHARLEPSKISILHVIEDAFGIGARRLDLGEGSFAYKRRFADAEELLLRLAVVPPSRRALHTALGLAPGRARAYAATHLSDAAKQRIRGLPAAARARAGG